MFNVSSNAEEMQNVEVPTRTVPTAEKLREAARDGLVREARDERYYIAINPGYAVTPKVYRTVLISRIVVCVVALVFTVLIAVGHGVPFASYGFGSGSVVWSPSVTMDESDMAITAARMAFATLALVFAVISLILSAVYAAAWAKMQKVRKEEEDANLQLQRAYGMEADSEEGGTETSFPFANRRVPDLHPVREVPMEEREQHRCKQDNDMGIAIFAMLIMTAVCAAITVGMMTRVPKTYVCRWPSSYWCTFSYDAGFGLFIAALALSVIDFIVVAIPQLTMLQLGGTPRTTRCQLMAVNTNRPLPGSEWAGAAHGHMYTSSGVPVAFLAPQGYVPGQAPVFAAEPRTFPDTAVVLSQPPQPNPPTVYSSGAYYTATA